MNKNYYYDIQNDLAAYPEAWAYLVWSGRNTGKTYSTLSYMLDTGARFVFLKRTKEDVNLILSGSGKIGTKTSEYGADMSPFKAINRDRGTNIKPFNIYRGYIGGFWSCDGENKPVGDPIGYIIPLSCISKVKGFDLSDCDYLIFDEFIPSPWERVDRQEGKQLLDLYITISRDREHKGLPPLKLICLANPTDVNCPVFQELELADAAAEMSLKKEEYKMLRGCLLHNIQMPEAFKEAEEKTAAIAAMSGTAWHDMTTGEGFAYNDMRMIGRQSLKGYKCRACIYYRNYTWYMYQKEEKWYLCRSRGIYPRECFYNLNTDQDARRFFIEWQIPIKIEYINGNVRFEAYTMFDVIINFRKFFPFV